MTTLWCFSCGAANSDEAANCHTCGKELHDKDRQAEILADVTRFRRVRDAGNGLLAILIAIVVVWLLTGPLLDSLLPPVSSDPWDSAARRWVPLGVVLLMVVAGFVPRLVGWLRLRPEHSWSAEQRATYRHLVGILPAEAFQGVVSVTSVSRQGTAHKWAMGCGAVFLIVIVLTVGLVTWVSPRLEGVVNRAIHTLTGGSISPGDLPGGLGSESDAPSALIAGRYEEFFPAEDLGSVTQSNQTWAYVFFADGTYTTYLEGSQQYSGTWTQSGSRLEVTVPAIPGLSDAYTFIGDVSASGDSFTVGETTWQRVGDS